MFILMLPAEKLNVQEIWKTKMAEPEVISEVQN